MATALAEVRERVPAPAFTAAFAWDEQTGPSCGADERRLFQVGDSVVVGRDARRRAEAAGWARAPWTTWLLRPVDRPPGEWEDRCPIDCHLSLIVPLAREHCVAKQKGGAYTVESRWRLPSERDVAAVRTRIEAAGHRPEPLSEGFLVRDPWHTAVAFVAHKQDEQSSARTNVRRVT
jgi:hypothetical protein